MGSFYTLSSDGKLGEIIASLYQADGSHVESYDRLHMAEICPESLIGKIEMGSKATYDAACSDGVTPILFSARFFSILETIGATGYRKCPITLIDQKKNEIDGFSALQVTGRCGRTDRKIAKAIVMPPPTPAGRPYVQFVGFGINETGWDGSDVFIPEGTLHVIVTEKVATALRSEKLNNVNITKTEEKKIHLASEDIAPVLGQAVFDDLHNRGLIR